VEVTLSVLLPVDAQSVPFARALCRDAFSHLAVEPSVVEQITLAISETCTNVVRHAGRSEYEVRVQIDGRRCRISVLDHGEGFEPDSLRPGSLLDGGLGLSLVRALVDSLEFGREDDGRNRVTFEKSLDPVRV
jgi:anti-sigma regulatory factor (Ser/Thr protein kinase)